MNAGRLLAIDHGLKRLGIAVSDPSRLVARELAIIHRKSNVEDLEKISRMIAEQGAVALVIGVPTNYEGSESQAGMVKAWVKRLTKNVPLPIVLWDEQLTSADARELARQQRRKQDAPVDDLAARVMLQSYLDALRDGLAEAPPAGKL